MSLQTVVVGIFLALVLVVLSGCSVVNGSGNVVTDERSIDSFDAIELSTDAEVTVKQGDSTFLTIRGEDNIIERIETVVRGERLIIRNRNRGAMTILRNREPIEITVSTPNLEDVDISGSGNVYAQEMSGSEIDITISGSGDVNFDRLETENMDVTISGSGDVRVEDLEADSIDVTINGSGDVKLEGEANRVEYSINGSGAIETDELAVNAADIRVNGSGEVEIWVKETLDVRINGSGDVSYHGNPQVDQRIGGSGDIIALGARE